MKTTIELPDDLLIEAKKRAAEERTTLRAIIEQGLRVRLGDESVVERPIRWVTVDGGAPSELEDRDSMYEWLHKS